MTSPYDLAFEELQAEICQYSPSAAQLLHQIKDSCGAQTAYYAAYVIVCIRAQQDLPAAKPLDEVTPTDLRDFTFFEAAKDNKTAITLFDEALKSYRTELTN